MENIHKNDIIDVELNGGRIFRPQTNRIIGEGDIRADVFGVRLFRNGALINLTGATVTGYFVRADGATVVIAGYVNENNIAYVRLPESCYAVEGNFALSLKIVGTGADSVDVTGTMRIVDGTVVGTTTGTIVDPGTLVPSIENLIEDIHDATEELEDVAASIPQDYSTLSGNVDRLLARTETVEYAYSDLDLPFRFNSSYDPTATMPELYWEDGTHYKTMDLHTFPGQVVWINNDELGNFSSLDVYVFVYAYNEDYTQMERFVLRSDNYSAVVDAAVMPGWAAHAYVTVGTTQHTVSAVDDLKIWITQDERGEQAEDGISYNPIVFESGRFYGDNLDIEWVESDGKYLTSNPLQLKAGDIVTCSSSDYKFVVFTFSAWTSHASFTPSSRTYYAEGNKHIVRRSGLAFIQVNRADGAEMLLDERIEVAWKFSGVSKQYRGDIRAALRIPKTSADFYTMFESSLDMNLFTKTLLGNEESPEELPIYLYKLNIGDKVIPGGEYYIDTRNLGYRKKVLITGAVHGNEKEGPSAILSFLMNLVENPRYAWLMGKYEFYIVPVVNPWGYSHHCVNAETGEPLYRNFSDQYTGPTGDFPAYANTSDAQPGIRPNYYGYNINRDFSDADVDVDSDWPNVPTRTYGFKTEEAKIIRDLIIQEHFDMVIDVHQHIYGRNISLEPQRYECGMAGMQQYVSSAADDGKTLPFYVASQEACSAADAYLEEQIGRPDENKSLQMSFVWGRKANGVYTVLKNYAGGYSYSGAGNTLHTDVAANYGITIETSQHCQTLAYARNAPHNIYTMFYGAVYVSEFIMNILRKIG